MALPSSGPLGLQMAQNEFGGSHPIRLTEFYGLSPGIPTSGQISFSQLRGKSSEVVITAPAIVGTPQYDGKVSVNVNVGTFFDATQRQHRCRLIIPAEARWLEAYNDQTFAQGLIIENYGQLLGKGGSGSLWDLKYVFYAVTGSDGTTGFRNLAASAITFRIYPGGKLEGGGGGGGGGGLRRQFDSGGGGGAPFGVTPHNKSAGWDTGGRGGSGTGYGVNPVEPTPWLVTNDIMPGVGLSGNGGSPGQPGQQGNTSAGGYSKPWAAGARFSGPVTIEEL